MIFILKTEGLQPELPEQALQNNQHKKWNGIQGTKNAIRIPLQQVLTKTVTTRTQVAFLRYVYQLTDLICRALRKHYEDRPQSSNHF